MALLNLSQSNTVLGNLYDEHLECMRTLTEGKKKVSHFFFFSNVRMAVTWAVAVQ